MWLESKLPEEFTKRIKGQLGDEYNAFLNALSSQVPTSILLNAVKSSSPPFDRMERLSWNPNGYLLEERPEFVFDPLFHAGAYYVMEAASMLLHEALESCGLPEDPIIVDLCAAPGGKSMVALNFMAGNGILVANEVNRKRYGILNENIAKWGHLNVITSNLDPSRLTFSSFADCVIVDAPCSGEGLFRKTPESVDEWSPANAMHCSLRQQRILIEAMRLIKPGGCLIYSTCTYNPDENIGNISWLAGEVDAESVALKADYRTVPVRRDNSFGYQCWPQRMTGEGFFLGILRKRGWSETDRPIDRNLKPRLYPLPQKETRPWEGVIDLGRYQLFGGPNNKVFVLPKLQAQSMIEIGGQVTASRIGGLAGEVKGTHVVPSHPLALSVGTSDEVDSISLSREEAIHYLRRNSLSPVSVLPGWYLANYIGYDLGWIKQAGKQTKNYYPIDWRIRKQPS